MVFKGRKLLPFISSEQHAKLLVVYSSFVLCNFTVFEKKFNGTWQSLTSAEDSIPSQLSWEGAMSAHLCHPTQSLSYSSSQEDARDARPTSLAHTMTHSCAMGWWRANTMLPLIVHSQHFLLWQVCTWEVTKCHSLSWSAHFNSDSHEIWQTWIFHLDILNSRVARPNSWRSLDF